METGNGRTRDVIETTEIIMMLKSDTNLLFVNVTLEGKERKQFQTKSVLDTGASSSIIFTSLIFKQRDNL